MATGAIGDDAMCALLRPFLGAGLCTPARPQRPTPGRPTWWELAPLISEVCAVANSLKLPAGLVVVVQIVNFINDTILTLLLMLMMLGTREGCVLLHKRPQPWPALACG